MARRRRLTPAQPGYTATLGEPLVPPVATQGLPGGASAIAPAATTPPIAQVTGQSAEAAALREMAEGIQAARDEGRMLVDVPLTDISPGHLLRDRVVLDREELETLKASIRTYGQRVPAEIVPLSLAPTSEEATGGPVYRFGLISGWRRLSALNELHMETGETRFSTLRAMICPAKDASESYVAMVEENEIRVGLSYYERARVVAELAHREVFPNRAAALQALFANGSRAKRSKINSFVDIYEALSDVLHFPTEIPERLGLALVAQLRQGRRAEIHRALAENRPMKAASELALLERLARPPAVSRAKQQAETLAPGVTLQMKRKNGQMTLILAGTGVDDALLDAVKQAVQRRN